MRWRKLERHLGVHSLVSHRTHTLTLVLLRQDLNHSWKFSSKVGIFTIVWVDKQSVAVASFRLETSMYSRVLVVMAFAVCQVVLKAGLLASNVVGLQLVVEVVRCELGDI